MTAGDWPCEAYGPDPAVREAGALCFVSPELHERVCESPAECHLQVSGARQQIWQRMNQGAAAGDPDMAYLAEEFSTPDRIMPGEDECDG